MLLEVKWEFRSLFLFDTVILGYLTILKNCQESSTFEAVKSACLSRCQRDVRLLFEMRWRSKAFCRVFSGDSDILSSCDMNSEQALRLCSEIWPSFESGHLGVHFAWSIKHRVPLTYIFLRENSSWGACGKLAYLFSRRQGIILIRDDMGCTEHSSTCSTEIDDPLYVRRLSQGVSRGS